jgi:hypothetical protein
MEEIVLAITRKLKDVLDPGSDIFLELEHVSQIYKREKQESLETVFIPHSDINARESNTMPDRGKRVSAEKS